MAAAATIALIIGILLASTIAIAAAIVLSLISVYVPDRSVSQTGTVLQFYVANRMHFFLLVNSECV